MVSFNRVHAILVNEKWLPVTSLGLLKRSEDAIERVRAQYSSIEGFEYLAAIRDLCEDGMNGDLHFIRYEKTQPFAFEGHLTFYREAEYSREEIEILANISGITFDRFWNSEDDQIYLPS